MRPSLTQSLCFLCLSTNRRTFHLLEEHRRLFCFLTNGYLQTYVRVCWECRASLQRCYSFKEQAQRAVRALESEQTGSQLAKLQCLSKLGRAQIVVIDLLVSEDLYIDTTSHKTEEPTKDEEQDLENFAADGIHIDPINNVIYIEDSDVEDIKPDDNDECIDATENKTESLEDKSNVSCSLVDEPPETKELKMELGLKTEHSDESDHFIDEFISESVEVERGGGWGETRKSDALERREQQQLKQKRKRNRRVLCGVNCRKRRLRTGNQLKNYYKCLACNCCCRSMEDWWKHDAQVHPRGAQPECSCNMKPERQVKPYVKVDYPARNPQTGTLDCDLCSSKLKQKDSYRKHYLTHISTERYECDICSKVFTTRPQIQIHVRTHNPSKMLCSICGRGFRSQGSLSIHMYAHSSIESRPYECDICSRKFIALDKLKVHKLYHTGVREFACQLCPSAYYVKFDLTRHLLQSHGISDPNSTNKKKCINRTPSMARNKKLKSGNQQFSRAKKTGKQVKEQNLLCNICGKRFASYLCLWAHKVVHTGARPYKCPKCDERFKFSSNVLTHVRSVHTDEKVHECATCGARFKLKGNLTAHMKQHTGEKPYACDICNQKFLHNRNLRNHYKVHGQAN